MRKLTLEAERRATDNKIHWLRWATMSTADTYTQHTCNKWLSH